MITQLFNPAVCCGALATSLGLVTAAPAGTPSFSSQDAFGTGATIPVAWGDYDGNGTADLAVGNFFGQLNELYTGNGDGTYTPTTEFGGSSTFALVWADYDNDGDLDMAVGNDGPNRLFINNGNGTFSLELQFGVSRTIAMAWADSDGDGDVDLAVGNGILGQAQQNALYLNNGDGTFTGQPQFGVGQTGSLAWADYDGDGDLDLAVGNGGFGSDGQNVLYVNNGDGTFTPQNEFGMGDTAAVAWADVNNDGRLDLAVANWGDQQNMLYLNDGGGSFTPVAAFGARDTNTIAWGDYDLDGDPDLAVGNGDFQSADQNYLYENTGGGSFAEHAIFGLGSTDSVAWADVDGDGDLDLAVGNEHTPTQNELWTNERAAGSYLTIKLVGKFHAHGFGFSNRDGIGARVTVYAEGHLGDPADRLGFQQVEAKGGFSAQNAIDLTFAAPGRKAVDVRIAWPGSDGESITQDIPSVATSQAVLIVETLLGDTNDDGTVNIVDFLNVLASWGPCPAPPEPCPADFDNSGTVDIVDFLTVLANWS